MKLTVAMILSLSLLTGFSLSDEILSNNEKNDMTELSELLHKNQITVSNWNVFERDEVSKAINHQDMEKKVQEFMNNKEDYVWNLVVEEKNHHYVWLGTKTNATYGFKENIKLKAYQNNGKYNIGMTYEVAGTELLPEHLDWIAKTFKAKKNVFYSVNGKMNSSTKSLQVIAEKMISDVKGSVVEQLQESSFVSISAFSNRFESELKTKDDETLNLQIGLRSNDTEIEVTIGTPIITTEY